VPMADLRELMTRSGSPTLRLYPERHVVFTTTETDIGGPHELLDQAVMERFKVPSHVVVVSRDELARSLATPVPRASNPKALHAVFRRNNLTADDVAAIEKARQRAAGKGGQDGDHRRRTLFRTRRTAGPQ